MARVTAHLQQVYSLRNGRSAWGGAVISSLLTPKIATKTKNLVQILFSISLDIPNFCAIMKSKRGALLSVSQESGQLKNFSNEIAAFLLGVRGAVISLGQCLA